MTSLPASFQSAVGLRNSRHDANTCGKTECESESKVSMRHRTSSSNTPISFLAWRMFW